MGLADLSPVFDMLDPSRKGYLSVATVKEFYETLNFQPVYHLHVQSCVRQICGPESKGKITKKFFSLVLQDLDRRVLTENQARWDFRALDENGSHTLCLKSALRLFEITHGPHFSVHTWRRFLSSRPNPDGGVCFDEMRAWLCELPEDTPTKEEELQQEQSRLDQLKQQSNNDRLEHLHQLQSAIELEVDETEDYADRTRRLAKRKLLRWQKDGVQALLDDDGQDSGDYLSAGPRTTLSVSDLLDELQNKYDKLRSALFWGMLQGSLGEFLWSTTSEAERLELHQQLVRQEKRMRRDGKLRESANQLQGSATSHDAQLKGIMGEVGENYAKVANTMNELRMKLKAEGKTDAEILKALKEDYEKHNKGFATSDLLLVQLDERMKQEERCLRADLASPQWGGGLTAQLCSLMRQLFLCDLEQDFSATAASVGLAERQHDISQEGYEPDKFRQEELAKVRLKRRRENPRQLKQLEDQVAVVGKHLGLVDLQLATVKEITRKHAAEREMLMQLLQCDASINAKKQARSMKPDQQTGRLTALRNQRTGWRDSAADYRTVNKEVHVEILQEGVGIYYERRCVELADMLGQVTDMTACSNVLADIQIHQDHEFDQLLTKICSKDTSFVISLLEEEQAAYSEEHYDTLAAVILGTFTCSEEEQPYINVLQEKYDTLRHVIFWHTLRVEYGPAWDRLDEAEQQRLVVKKRLEEVKLRQDGALASLAELTSKLPQDIGSIATLMGENRAEYNQRMKAHYRQQQNTGKTSTQFADEISRKHTKSSNLLADLLQRFYAEQDDLVGWLRSAEQRGKAERHVRAPLAVLRLEKRRADREETFDIAGYSVGLTERINSSLETRHRADQKRQHRLGRLRLDARKRRIEQSLPYFQERDDYAPPEKGDLQAWEVSYLFEMDKKQREERELLLRMLQDPGMEDLIEAAKNMTPEDQQKRLAELLAKRANMDLSRPGDQDENISVLEEAAAVRVVIKQRVLHNLGQGSSPDEVAAHLLAEVQELQDREMASAVRKFYKMEEEELKIARECQVSARHWNSADHVLFVLTKYEGTARDGDFVKALSEKYEALREFLILESLIQNTGESEWVALSEQQRQTQLRELKAKHQQLRREGKLEELGRLVADASKTGVSLRQLMGDELAEYEKKLQDALARSAKFGFKGDEDPFIDDSKAEEIQNIAQALEARFEKERVELLSRLRGREGNTMSERVRQIELVRLKREANRAKLEDKFSYAAVTVGLAERQHILLTESSKHAMERRILKRLQTTMLLRNDRARQMNLAAYNLERARNKAGLKEPHDDKVVRGEGTLPLQEAILQKLDKCHQREREMFAEMLEGCEHQVDLKMLASSWTAVQRADWLERRKNDRQSLPPENVTDNTTILSEACVVKLESRRITLTQKQEEDVDDYTIGVHLMADLQERQDQAVANYIKTVTTYSEEELIQLQVKVMYDDRYQRVLSLASLLLSPESSPNPQEDNLVTALHDTYDALRDQLLTDALIKQMGEAEWMRLSERERQMKLLELKLKEKRLREQGLWDDAMDLLGEAGREFAAYSKLLGETKEEQQRKLKERLQRRKERKAAGMSDEECDRLEKVDIEKEEEEDKKRRNILKDLHHNYEAEQAALLEQLNNKNSSLANERARQLHMAMLRRQQRMFRQEQTFEAAALVLALSQSGIKAKEDERIRQEQLARARLANRGQRPGASTALDVPFPDDEDDPDAMFDAVMRQIERKHEAERQLIIQVLHEEISGEHRAAAKNMSPEERGMRLEELRELRKYWRDQGGTGQKEHDKILREAATLQLENAIQQLTGSGCDSSDESAQVMLLANLQQMQDAEIKESMKALADKEPSVLKHLKNMESQAAKSGWYDNVAKVLLAGEVAKEKSKSSPDEQAVIDALDEKYDAMRDKLLLEVLKQQIGEAEWAMMSEKERQNRLVKMRLEERRMRREGRLDEAARLMGDMMARDADMQKRLGDTREQHNQRMEERKKKKVPTATLR